MWFWVAKLRPTEDPLTKLQLIGSLDTFLTAVLVAVEARRLGVGGPNDLRKQGRRRTGPTGWFFGVLFLWFLAYPCWLFRRSRYGARNLLIWGILATSAFVGSLLVIGLAIEGTQQVALLATVRWST